MNIKYISEFEKLTEKFMDSYKAQGIAISIFDENNVLYQNFFGKRNIEENLDIDENTIFGIASITKSFTCIAALKMVEDGIIDLDAPITDYLPELNFKDNPVPCLSHLMSHSAGIFPKERFLISDFIKNLNLNDPDDAIYRNSIIAEEGFKAIANALNSTEAFISSPGKYFSYSNFSYGIITELIRRYGGERSYCDMVENRIIKALKLNRTFFDFERTNSEENITKLYTVNKNIVSSSSDYKEQGYVLMGGGGIKSTLHDMTKYTQIFLNDGICSGEEIISKNIIRSMEEPRIIYRNNQSYGFALVLGRIDDFSFSGHSGGLPGVSSFFGFSRELSKGVVILCNTENVPVTALAMAALRLSAGSSPDFNIFSYNDESWSEDKLFKSQGIFESEEGNKVTVSLENGKLYISANEEKFEGRTSPNDSIIIKNKLEEVSYRLLRDSEGIPWGIYSGSRILPKK